jgi:TonB family protein
MAASGQHKILRIGVIQGGKIIEERLLKRRESVTIGAGPKNTIVVPAGGLPDTFQLFEVRGQQYSLGFSEQMDGKVSLSDTAAVDFDTLKQSGQARSKPGGLYSVPLPETARGKVQLGEVTVLFQYVTPPPEPPRPVLPVSARGGFFGSLDKLFFGTVMGMLILNYTLTYFVWNREVTEAVTLEEIPDRFVKMIMPERQEEPPPPEEKPQEQVAETPKETPKDTGPEKPADKGPATPQEMEKKVSKAGLLQLLGSEGDGSGAIADVLQDGAAGPADVAEALNGATRIDNASADSINSNLKGGGTGKAAGIGDLGTSGGGGVGLGPKKDVIVAKVETLGGPEVESSSIDKAMLARVVKGRLRSIQACYEKELKRNPSLKGRIVVRFTIGTTGRVTSVDIDENSLNGEVANCIRTTIRFWTFPVKPEEEVPVSYPFVFAPASG